MICVRGCIKQRRIVQVATKQKAKKEITAEYTVIEETNKIVGSVVNCQLLNIRENPGTDRKPISVLSFGEEVEILDGESNAEWVKVKTEFGIEGYCMSKYIEISIER